MIILLLKRTVIIKGKVIALSGKLSIMLKVLED